MKLDRIINIFVAPLLLWWILMPNLSTGEDWYSRLLECTLTQQDTFFFKSTDSQILAWNESFVLRTYLSCYQINQDSLWIKKAIQHITSITNNMYDIPQNTQAPCWEGYRDGYKGWGTLSHNQYQEHLLHDAYIIIPILRFYLILHQSPNVSSKYSAIFSQFIQTIEKNIIEKWRMNWDDIRTPAVHDGTLEHWSGWFNLPHHQYSAMGTVFCLLSRISRLSNTPLKHQDWDDWYSETAWEMAEFLKSNLKVNTQLGAYYWNYDANGGRIENINQGDITIEFILAAKDNDIVFDDVDIFRLLNALRYRIWNRDKDKPKFYYCVDGTYSEDNGFQMRTWVFFSLLDFDLQEAFDANLKTYINHHPLLKGEIRGGKTSCTIANLAYVLSRKNFFQPKAIH